MVTNFGMGDGNDLLSLLTSAASAGGSSKKTKRPKKKHRSMMMAATDSALTDGDGGFVRSMAMLHSPDVACVDTGGSRLISTDPRQRSL